MYFAKPDAMKGSLVETMLWCKPTIFFAVPRIWEKLEAVCKGIILKYSEEEK